MDRNEKNKYELLADDPKTSVSDDSIADSQHRLLPGDHILMYNTETGWPTQPRYRALIAANGVLFFLSVAALAASAIIVGSSSSPGHNMNAALKQTSAYCELHHQL